MAINIDKVIKSTQLLSTLEKMEIRKKSVIYMEENVEITQLINKTIEEAVERAYIEGYVCGYTRGRNDA